MADDCNPPLEEQKKLLLPFMQRAQEVQKADPKVAYYCRLFAVDQALKFPQRHKEINGLVLAALAALEKDKERLGLDREADRVHCEAFALRIFGNADRVDRQGKADMNTSKAYYAAVFFIEILNQFQTLDADFSGKQKYAAWRASEIRKALREGRPPVPPTQDEVRQAQEAEEMATLDQALPNAPPPAPTPPTDGLSGLNIAGANIAGANVAPGTASRSNSYEAPPPPQPHLPSVSDGAPMPPPIPPVMPPPAPAVPPDMQRFWQGSPVYFCPAPGLPIESGTVGCPLPGGRYMVGLQDRLVEAEDGQLAPAVTSGAHVSFMPFPGGPLVPAEVLMMNNSMGWPPSYLVRPQNGKEQAAAAHQIALLPLSPQPTQHSRDGSVRSGVSASPSNSSLHSLQHQQQQPHAPQPPPVAPPPHFPGAASSPPPTGPYPGIHSPPMGPLFGGPPPSMPSQPSMPSYQHQPPAPAQPPVQPPARPPAPANTARPPQPASTPHTGHARPAGAKGLPINVINDAQKKAKYAVSALNFEDVHSAIKYLSESLQLLTTDPR